MKWRAMIVRSYGLAHAPGTADRHGWPQGPRGRGRRAYLWVSDPDDERGRLAALVPASGGPYALAAAATLPEIVSAVCVFASIGPYGEPGLDWAEGLGGDERREEIRKFFEEPERARAEFHAQSAITLAEGGSAGWWLQRWGERAGQDDAHSREWADYLALCIRDARLRSACGTA
jgi:hypothetical protein